MAHQDPVTGHTVLDPCDFTPQGCTDASAAANQASNQATATAEKKYYITKLLPAGASYVPVPPGYPLNIAPYITKEGALNIPVGQGAMTDDQIGWLMVALQNAINQGPPAGTTEYQRATNPASGYVIKPYNINFVDYNKAGQIDNSGAQIIKSETDPTKAASFHGVTSQGTYKDGYPNYDYFLFPAIYSNIKQPGLGVMDAITTVIGAVAPIVGIAAGAVDKKVHDEANDTSTSSKVSGGIPSGSIPTTTGTTSGSPVGSPGNPLTSIANATGLSTTEIIGILLLLILLIYWYFKK